jgi:hypothetical protein
LRRAIVLISAVFIMVVAACGSSGPSVEDWVEGADSACGDAAGDLEEAETLDQVQDVGEDNAEVLADNVDAVKDVEPPGNEDDAAATDDVIDGLDDLAQLAEDRAGTAGDGEADDELTVTRVEVEHADAIDEGAGAADDLDMDDCADLLGDADNHLEERVAQIELLDDLGELVVGDCVGGLDDEVGPADCDSDDADGTIRAVYLSDDPDCPNEADVTQTIHQEDDDVEVDLGLCVETFAPDPEETDNVWEIGSCIEVTDNADGGQDGTEVPCDDATASHSVVAEVGEDEDCLSNEIRFDKSDNEVDISGPGGWCLASL